MVERKTTVRILSILLTLILLVGLVPASALAAEFEEPEIEEAAVETAEVEAAPAEEAADPVIAAEEVFEAAEAVEVPEIEAVPVEAESEEEAEALPEPAAEAEAEGQETYTVRYLTYTGSYDGPINSATFSHAAGETVYVSEYKYTIDHYPNPSLLKNNEQYRYVFDGWSLTEGNVNNPPDTVYPLNYAKGSSFVMPDHDVDLYAHYEVIEYYHWELSVGANGTVSHELSSSEGSSTSETIELSSASEPYKVFTTGSKDGGFTVIGTVYRSFVPQPGTGYIFDGWYCNDEKLNVETLNAASFPVLTAAMYNAGQNKIEARFMEASEDYVRVVFETNTVEGDFTYHTVYLDQMLKKGDPMPTVADPTWANHYFLGWDQEVPDTVPETDVTFTAQWLQGPTTSNTAEALYTVHCVNGGHQDETQGMYWGKSNNDITEDNGRYTCSVTLETIGTYLGIGPACYNVLSGQVHFAEDNNPVIHLVWNGNLWVADGEQVVNVYHEKKLSQKDLAAISICVKTNDGAASKTLKLIDGTYEVHYDFSNNPTSASATVTITKFDAYAKKLGKFYVPDWGEDAPHHESDFEFAFTLSSHIDRPAAYVGTNDHSKDYYVWDSWTYAPSNLLPGEDVMTLQVKIPTYTVAFTDGISDPVEFYVPVNDLNFPWKQSPWNGNISYFANDNFPFMSYLYDMQLEDGRVFAERWDPDPLAYEEQYGSVFEDVTFEAVWARSVWVVYRDGSGDTLCETDNFFLGLDPLPACDDVPTRDGYYFAGWKSVADEGVESFIDEETGYTVNTFIEDDWQCFYIVMEAQWTDTEPSDIDSTSVSFDGKLNLNVYIKLSEEIKADADAYIITTFNGVTTTFYVADLIEHIESDGCVKVRQGMFAGMMRDEMTLQVFNGNGEIQPLTYKGSTNVTDGFVFTAVDYLRSRQQHSSNVKMQELARAAELYGAAVQVYFKYHTELLTAEDIAAVQAAAGEITIPKFNETEGTLPAGITDRSKTVLFEEDNTLRMYFNLDDAQLGNYSFSLNGEEATPVKKKAGEYYIQQPNIAPAILDTSYSFGVSDGTSSYTMETSVLAYAYNRQQKSSNPDMINLAKLLYRYYLAASDYFMN